MSQQTKPNIDDFRSTGVADAVIIPSQRFAENMRRSRERRGFSQQTLAFRCGLHRTEISLLERGDRDPRLSTLVRLARALECTPSSLLEDVH